MEISRARAQPAGHPHERQGGDPDVRLLERHVHRLDIGGLGPPLVVDGRQLGGQVGLEVGQGLLPLVDAVLRRLDPLGGFPAAAAARDHPLDVAGHRPGSTLAAEHGAEQRAGARGEVAGAPRALRGPGLLDPVGRGVEGDPGLGDPRLVLLLQLDLGGVGGVVGCSLAPGGEVALALAGARRQLQRLVAPDLGGSGAVEVVDQRLLGRGEVRPAGQRGGGRGVGGAGRGLGAQVAVVVVDGDGGRRVDGVAEREDDRLVLLGQPQVERVVVEEQRDAGHERRCKG